MDETPMCSKPPSTRSLEFTDSRTVPVKTCRAEKRSFTVTLAIAAGGTKLPPKVIFKGVRSPKDLIVPESLRVSFHKKGWMDEAGVKEWIRQCLPLTPHNEQLLLVWDSFRTHLTDEVKADLNQREIDVAVIPGGLTPVLQPLDKCLNKPFKDNVRRKYLVWMISSPFNYTPARKKSFKTCGISNSLDGTEDDELYTEEAQEIHDDEEDNEFEMEREGESDSK